MIAFGGAPDFDGAPAFSASLAWEEAAFDEAAPMPYSAIGTFGATAFRSDTFACFPTGPAPTSFLLFFAASLLASDPGSKWGP
jgi:hypothetical protein